MTRAATATSITTTPMIPRFFLPDLTGRDRVLSVDGGTDFGDTGTGAGLFSDTTSSRTPGSSAVPGGSGSGIIIRGSGFFSCPATTSGFGFFAREGLGFRNGAGFFSGASVDSGRLSLEFPTIVPQEEQNRAPGVSGVPQREHDGGGPIRAPQDSQKAVSGGTGLWHLGHEMVFFFFGPGSFMTPFYRSRLW